MKSVYYIGTQKLNGSELYMVCNNLRDKLLLVGLLTHVYSMTQLILTLVNAYFTAYLHIDSNLTIFCSQIQDVNNGWIHLRHIPIEVSLSNFVTPSTYRV